MPELPEVERGRRIAERVLRGRALKSVRAADDRIVFDELAPRTIARRLRGRTVVEAHRHGKQLWFEFDEGPALLLHFGMTGGFRVPAEAPLQLASSGKKVDSRWPPRFTKIHFVADDGGELVMTNARRLGRIRLRDEPREEPPISRLGFDPLLDMPSPKRFIELAHSRKTPVKALLLDQGFAAGVGNWIADEALYQAKIDPRRRASDLENDELRRLRTALGRVIRKAVAVNAVKSEFPRSWLFHHRWGRNGSATTTRGEAIEHLSVGGRTTAWVPSVQR
ncbi:MAG: Fpg/Nei family DNA glycosylase [Phycisphaerales bacterium]